MSDKKGEPQYREMVERLKQDRLERMGYMSSGTYISDPRRLTFLLSRYKFVAKMMDGFDSALEVGCGDTFGTRLVAQTVSHVTAVDFDPEFIGSVQENMSKDWPLSVKCHDILEGPVAGNFDGVYSLVRTPEQ